MATADSISVSPNDILMTAIKIAKSLACSGVPSQILELYDSIDHVAAIARDVGVIEALSKRDAEWQEKLDRAVEEALNRDIFEVIKCARVDATEQRDAEWREALSPLCECKPLPLHSIVCEACRTVARMEKA